jgi:lysozyme family protein
MKDLDFETAKMIYKKNYWDVLKLDQIENQEVANQMFDTGVNCGVGIAVKHLQRALNLLNRNNESYIDPGTDEVKYLGWEDVKVDGLIGDVTLNIVRTKLKESDMIHLVNSLNGLQFMRYVEICERDVTQKKFYRGWIKRTLLTSQTSK